MKQLFFTIFALLILNSAYAQVKATSAEINTGTDDAKFATALALQGSKYLDQNGGKLSAVTAAGANTYNANISPAITGYSSGQVFYVKITTANTGASTLNLNGLGAKALVKDVASPLIAGDLLANKVYAVYYDGTNFQVMNGIPSSVGGDHTGKYISKTGNDSFNGKLAPLSGTALDAGLYGNYAPARLGHIWAIGPSYSINPNGADFGNVYGMTYQFTNSGGNVTGGTKALSHQIAFSANGINGASIGLAGNIWNMGWFRGGSGTPTSPTYTFNNFPTTGMYSAGTDALGFSAAGLLKMSVTPTSIVNHTNVVNNTLSQRIWDPAATVTGSRSFYDITYYNNGTATPAGGLRVDLPIGTSTMWVARITMMEYDTATPTNAKTTDLIITGYAVTNVNFSVLCNAPDRIAQVRIGRNAANTKTVLMITTNDGTLKYLKANLREFTVYHTSHTAAAFEDPGQYNMSLATDDTDYVHTRTILNSGFVRDSYALNYNNLTNKPVLGNTVLKAGDEMTGKLTISSTESAKLILQQSAVNQQNIIDLRNESGTSMGYVGKPSAASNNMSITSRTGDVTFAAANLTRLTVSPTVLTSTIPYSGTSGTFSGLVQASSIGIGTTNVSGYKLAVGGGIIAESVKVKPQGSWPDYVFEKDYPILPINELEKFVLKNKHLPNIPNAAEVKKDGIDMGEMNAKLLQKIEELTLYIIDQQKNIIDQQKGLRDQQKEIKDLKTNELRLSKAVEKLSLEMNLLKNQ